MSTFITRDPQIIAAYHAGQVEHDAYSDRLFAVKMALELDDEVTFMQSGYGAVKFIIGIKTPDGSRPAGWKPGGQEEGTLVPDESVHEGIVARILLDGLGNVPNARACLLESGMPTDVLVGAGPEARITVPTVRLFQDDQVIVTWRGITPDVTGSRWEQVR